MAVGAVAEFRCRHPTADAIRWRVNGSLVGRSPPPDIIPSTTHDDNGNLVDTLTITARREYNGTEVVCVARFDDGSLDEQTEPATLLGTIGIAKSCILFILSSLLSYSLQFLNLGLQLTGGTAIVHNIMSPSSTPSPPKYSLL